ncbi:MAG TPA: hypothetical protein VF215_08700 [Thermoanaerobaculia bacterium]
MNDHPATDDLRRWRRGDVDEHEMLAIADHLSTCDECTADAAQRPDLDRAAIDLCDELADDPAATERRGIAGRPWLFALAASVVIAIASGVWLRRIPPPRIEHAPRISRATPAPSPIDESETFTREVRNGASIPMPERLRSVLGESDVLRGTSAATGALEPAGVVVTTARPEFSWPAPPGSRSVVEIFSGETDVMRSPALATDRWQATRDLPRGVTYTWTVRVEHDGNTQILPAAPSPVARFHVLDRTTLEAFETAKRLHADDHFLLGLLYARAGVVDAARGQFERITDPADAAIARRVLHDLESRSSR